MTTRTPNVDGREILTDSEGYLVDPAGWSEAFVKELASHEGLVLSNEHWELVCFLRDYYESHGA